MEKANGRHPLVYANRATDRPDPPNPPDRTHGRALLIYTMIVLLIPWGLGACCVVVGLMDPPIGHGSSAPASPTIDHVYAILGWMWIGSFLLSIPASSAGLIWWACLFWRWPKFKLGYVTFALLALLASFAAIAYTIYAFLCSLPSGRDLH